MSGNRSKVGQLHNMSSGGGVECFRGGSWGKVTRARNAHVPFVDYNFGASGEDERIWSASLIAELEYCYSNRFASNYIQGTWQLLTGFDVYRVLPGNHKCRFPLKFRSLKQVGVFMVFLVE